MTDGVARFLIVLVSVGHFSDAVTHTFTMIINKAGCGQGVRCCRDQREGRDWLEGSVPVPACQWL
ncbi:MULTISPECIES: hypothetical protein [unclassified Vibrio]|uniref:Uncharacterized protein n=1 Tax=Vibrio sp. HB236076 TaxID=3232307 RepID=A0AB39HF41_9VIBR|nr:hypothetical protein [Vibrio sp. HB161653]MDP5252954.1 hypothetical protein [Vibrio sp. HB161653]